MVGMKLTIQTGFRGVILLSDKRFAKRVVKLRRKIKTRAQRRQLRELMRGAHHIETSKLLAVYLFVLLNAIVVYSMVVMAISQDLSSLPVLISDLAAQVLVYAIYCAKAFKGKQAEENMRFEREKLGISDEDELCESDEPEG